MQASNEGKGAFSSMQVACIEQLLTAKGEIFVGTAKSAFTKEIIMERRFLGFDDLTRQSFTLVPGPKTRTMCAYGPIYFAGALRTRITNPRDDAERGKSSECEPW